MSKLTLIQAIAIQAEQLEDWGRVLTYDVHAMLREEARTRNAAILRTPDPDPYEIWRGGFMSTWIQNYALRLKSADFKPHFQQTDTVIFAPLVDLLRQYGHECHVSGGALYVVRAYTTDNGTTHEELMRITAPDGGTPTRADVRDWLGYSY